MKVIYDPETDSLSIVFREKPIAESDELREGIIMDYDNSGNIVSIEVLNASKQVTEPKGIQYELKEPKVVFTHAH